jgi:hypothetical protein
MPAVKEISNDICLRPFLGNQQEFFLGLWLLPQEPGSGLPQTGKTLRHDRCRWFLPPFAAETLLTTLFGEVLGILEKYYFRAALSGRADAAELWSERVAELACRP